jgi:nitrite reductase/ring-hydroxylating ferredoxin subunit
MLADVGAIDEFEEGRMQIRRAGRWELGILRLESRTVAIKNVCPHIGAPLCLGPVSTALTGRTGSQGHAAQIEVRQDRTVVVCPWHRWEFDVETGEALFDPTLKAKVYPVTIADGRVLVDIPSVGQ